MSIPRDEIREKLLRYYPEHRVKKIPMGKSGESPAQRKKRKKREHKRAVKARRLKLRNQGG